MNPQFLNKRQLLTVTSKHASVGNYLTNQKYFTGHMLNTKLKGKSYKLRLKVIPVKIKRSKKRQGSQYTPYHPPRGR